MLKMNYSVIVICCLFFALPAWSQLSSPAAVNGEYIVKFKNKVSVSAGLKIVGKMGAAVSIKTTFAGSQMVNVKVNSVAARDALYANPDVEFVEPNYIMTVDPVDISVLGSAPLATDNYSQSNSNVRVKESWSIQKPYNQGDKIIVAVIDTGLDRNHLVFKDSGSIWENALEKSGIAGVDDDANGLVDDINGWNYNRNNSNINDDNNHGTHVAGIVLGVGQDILANPVRESKIKIMGLKFLDSTGAGSTADAISAIYYAVNNGAKIINNSWGGPSFSQSLQEAYTYAYNRGVVIVTAAGNSNTNNDTSPIYPSNFNTPNNIGVLATTDYDSKASFSNYGATSVSVAAPGVSILSSVPGSNCSAPGCFRMMSGTSMAAPFVAGLAALIVREAPQLSAYQIRSIVLGSIDTVTTLAGRVSTSGRVNAYRAIVDAQAQVGTTPWAPSYSTDTARSPASEAASGAAKPAGCGLVKVFIDGAGSGGGSAGGGSSVGSMALVLSMILLPLVVAVALRAKVKIKSRAKSNINRRLFARYTVAKQVVLQISDQIVNITTQDISAGGISFKGDMSLQKGQVVKVKLDDNRQESIEAEVVWCSTKQEFGLKFLNITDAIKYEIQSWIGSAVPTA